MHNIIYIFLSHRIFWWHVFRIENIRPWMCDLVQHSFGNYNSLRQGQRKYSSSLPADRNSTGIGRFWSIVIEFFRNYWFKRYPNMTKCCWKEPKSPTYRYRSLLQGRAPNLRHLQLIWRLCLQIALMTYRFSLYRRW